MWCGRIWFSSLAIFLLLAGQAGAATWRVEQDGSGDFTAIQPAINAASHGDSILIGPGHYTEYQTVTLPGWSWPVDVYAYVIRNNLTIIGADVESVVIGPDSSDFHDFSPKGIVVVRGISQLAVEHCAFQNLYGGIFFLNGSLTVHGCRFRTCKFGLTGYEISGSTISSCEFSDTLGPGLKIDLSSQDVQIEDSIFTNCDSGIYIELSTNIHISNCTFLGDGTASGSIVGAKFTNHSTGEVNNCSFRDIYSISIVSAWYSNISIIENDFHADQANVSVYAGAHVTGHGNLFSGGTVATLIFENGTMELHKNHILNNGGNSARVEFFPGSLTYLDLRNNYWGTDDQVQIEEWIWDWNDDSSVNAIVLFEPYSDQPMPTEKKSLGEVKALYR